MQGPGVLKDDRIVESKGLGMFWSNILGPETPKLRDSFIQYYGI